MVNALLTQPRERLPQVADDTNGSSGQVALQLRASQNGLTIRDATLFGNPASEEGRAFLSRVFSVEEVDVVEIDRAKGLGRIQYQAAAKIGEVLRKLRRALDSTSTRAGSNPTITEAVAALYLENPAPIPIRISRIGSYLSTWRVLKESNGRVRLTHPVLRNSKDITYRLEEELAAVQGVRDYKKKGVFSSSIVVRYNPRRIDVPHLLHHLEYRWPRLINGLEGPPPTTRFLASSTLLSLAFTGQYFVPVLTPFVLLGLAVYSFPNVVNGLKMIRKGKVGLPVLYTGTLTFTVLSGQPFAATLMATFMQAWPQWAHKTLTKSQRQLFAAHRQRATWARKLNADGTTSEVNLDELKAGDIIVVNDGEIIPADGTVSEGLAAVDEEALSGRAGALDKAPGDAVHASSFIKTGSIRIKVTRIGLETMAGFIGAQLPQGKLVDLPESAEAENVANGMVSPALALSAANLLLTGDVQPSQSTIRPDYATGPRLSAQLGALHDLSDALRRGIVFRDPVALGRLPATDIYVFDESSALERRRIAVEEIFTLKGITTNEVLSCVTSAFPSYQNNRARALMERSLDEGAPLLDITERTRRAGVISYRDAEGRLIEIATPAYLDEVGITVPATLKAAIHATDTAWAPQAKGEKKKRVPHPEPQVRPLWAIRDGKILGVVTFQRSGELEGVEVIATLRARNAQARFFHVSSRPQKEAEAVANAIGITAVAGGLTSEQKAEVVKKLGRRTMWLGDGSLKESKPCIDEATISISVAGATTVPVDSADVIFLQPSLIALVPLRRIGRRHRALLKDGYKWVFAANLFCVAGAFFGGFTTLTVAITSNFATGYVYNSHRKLLNDLIHRMEAKRAKDVTSSDAEEHDPGEGTSDAGAHVEEHREEISEGDADLDVAAEIRPI